MGQEWGSQPLDFNQEPKKVFVNYLIWHLKIIGSSLYFGGRASAALRGLVGLVSSLDEDSQKKLEPQLKRMQAWEDGTSYYRKDVDLVYREVSSYLHKTYLKEVNYARPKYKPGKL